MVNVAVIAKVASFPLNCPADVRERGAESSFYAGGRFACCHRNDTNAAKGSVNATAVPFGSAAAVIAVVSRQSPVQ